MNKFLSYAETKDVINKNENIKSAFQFFCWHRKNKPQNIPFHPERQYKNNGWIDWMKFLNTNNVCGGNRKYKVNDNYFKTWSNNMAYILGFWFADGCINVEKNTFSITQHKKDTYILESILKELDSDYKLSKHGENNLCFCIVSKTIVEDIKKLGGCERKSLVAKFPKVPKKYLPHFIRGLWDGDGSVYYNKQYKKYVSSFASGSKKFIDSLFEILNKTIKDFDCKVYKNYKNYCLSIGINDTIRLFHFLYTDANCLKLERKYNIFKQTGKINIACQNRVFKSFSEAKKLAKQNKIKTYREWRKKCKKISKNLPLNPDNTYKGCWKGWNYFLGTNFWKYQKAKQYVHALKLASINEWKEYSKTKRIRNIPSNPWSVYKEWDGLDEWLGNKKK